MATSQILKEMQRRLLTALKELQLMLGNMCPLMLCKEMLVICMIKELEMQLKSGIKVRKWEMVLLEMPLELGMIMFQE